LEDKSLPHLPQILQQILPWNHHPLIQIQFQHLMVQALIRLFRLI